MKKHILTLLTITSFAILAGCASDPASVNTNTGTTVTQKQNENAEVVVKNTNEEVNTNTVVNKNLNTEQGSEIDTSDWLTYTNEEYGFSFKYPDHFYTNYTSQNKLPLRTLLQDVPKERTEDMLGSTYDELLAEREEIEQATIDDLKYRQLGFGPVAKVTVRVEEGGGIVKRYTWYDDEYRYTMQFVFPVSSDMAVEFREAYPNTEKVNKFIEEVISGNAPKKYQIWFDELDDIMNTFHKL